MKVLNSAWPRLASNRPYDAGGRTRNAHESIGVTGVGSCLERGYMAPEQGRGRRRSPGATLGVGRAVRNAHRRKRSSVRASGHLRRGEKRNGWKPFQRAARTHHNGAATLPAKDRQQRLADAVSIRSRLKTP